MSPPSAIPSKFKVALIQLNPKPLDPSHNFLTAATHIRDAAFQGATLAVLPEYHLTGWVPSSSLFASIAENADYWIAQYQDLAREVGICIVPGTIVTSDGKGHLLNIAIFINSDGTVLGQYTKANLWHPEREYLTSGPHHMLSSLPSDADADAANTDAANADAANDTKPQHHGVIDTPFGPVGLLICYDLFFPEAFRALVRLGARIIIIPTYTKSTDPCPAILSLNPATEALFIKSALVTRAFENTCCVIFCNVGGPAEEGFVGMSSVTLPVVGTLEGGFEGGEEGCKVVGVDMGVCETAEGNYKIREDLGREGFHYS